MDPARPAPLVHFGRETCADPAAASRRRASRGTAWMAHGRNTTYVRYRVLRGGPVALEVTPLVTHGDHLELRPMDQRPMATRAVRDALAVGWYAQAGGVAEVLRTLRLAARTQGS